MGCMKGYIGLRVSQNWGVPYPFLEDPYWDPPIQRSYHRNCDCKIRYMKKKHFPFQKTCTVNIMHITNLDLAARSPSFL